MIRTSRWALWWLITACCMGFPAVAATQMPTGDTLTVLVTDSGLGGLSVAAAIEAQAAESRTFRKLRVIFCNALPGDGKGYNDLPSLESKARLFSAALEGMQKRFSPDVILIACNTLSVVYPHTAFAHKAPVPVIGIVGIAVDLLVPKLLADPQSLALLLGTETTIASGAHRLALIAAGIDSARIVSEACPKLESEIQTDPAGDVVNAYLDMFTAEAAAKTPTRPSTIFAGLCCTHYGYAARSFQRSLEAAYGRPVILVNPNQRMAELLFHGKKKRAYPVTDVSIEVVSRAELSNEERESIAGLLDPVSHPAAKALRMYRRVPDLFILPHE